MRKLLIGVVVVLGACTEPAPQLSSTEPALELSSQSAVEADAHPSVTIVYECTIDGRWWATRAVCQSNCAGGTCFACGALCQN